jgi:hypothetical protein
LPNVSNNLANVSNNSGNVSNNLSKIQLLFNTPTTLPSSNKNGAFFDDQSSSSSSTLCSLSSTSCYNKNERKSTNSNVIKDNINIYGGYSESRSNARYITNQSNAETQLPSVQPRLTSENLTSQYRNYGTTNNSRNNQSKIDQLLPDTNGQYRRNVTSQTKVQSNVIDGRYSANRNQTISTYNNQSIRQGQFNHSNNTVNNNRNINYSRKY